MLVSRSWWAYQSVNWFCYVRICSLRSICQLSQRSDEPLQYHHGNSEQHTSVCGWSQLVRAVYACMLATSCVWGSQLKPGYETMSQACHIPLVHTGEICLIQSTYVCCSGLLCTCVSWRLTSYVNYTSVDHGGCVWLQPCCPPCCLRH